MGLMRVGAIPLPAGGKVPVPAANSARLCMIYRHKGKGSCSCHWQQQGLHWFAQCSSDRSPPAALLSVLPKVVK